MTPERLEEIRHTPFAQTAMAQELIAAVSFYRESLPAQIRVLEAEVGALRRDNERLRALAPTAEGTSR